MLVAIALVVAGLALPIASRLLVAATATLLGIAMIRRSRRLEQALIHAGVDHRGRLDHDRGPSRAERRQMRAHLRLAIRQVELASLLPGAVANARHLADRRASLVQTAM